jgi:hemerythrin superfamily protein
MTKPDTISATELLRQRHKEIENMFDATVGAANEQRSELFDCLRATLAVHETVEELFVHPVARRTGPDGERVVKARLKEEAEAAKVLAELENLGSDGDQFGTRLAMLRRAVLEHAEHEEKELFPIMEGGCSSKELNDLADAIVYGEQLAPTHAHPHLGQNPVELMLVGPFVAIVDRARDHLKAWRASRS